MPGKLASPRLGAFAHSFQGGVPGHAWAEPVERADTNAAGSALLSDIRRRAWFVYKGQRKNVDWLVRDGLEDAQLADNVIKRLLFRIELSRMDSKIGNAECKQRQRQKVVCACAQDDKSTVEPPPVE